MQLLCPDDAVPREGGRVVIGRVAIEAFVSELDLSLAGSASDGGYGLAVDESGDVYVTGFTKSVDFLADTAFPPSRTTTFKYDDLAGCRKSKKGMAENGDYRQI